MTASVLPVAERFGATTRKFDACLPGGAAAAPTTRRFGAACGDWRGSSATTEPASRTDRAA